ncbi:uncharacterized protein LOC125801710 [Astyanax mexicanus]|uniref:uncharacterized protein LOC111188497 n=1 Tax=Astyanax mexicanus TaxID=7994 RepID=UPI0020CAD748|nr:uncharacterized protein LOC111188497 [Astyanax mexicanus]XP_049331497.1 uncharacterized protein LOC125799262 [Astyanax mexicanus]XP_049334763.1 uncharacterized protein LOC125801710 [Astyanax mexicanus]
MAESKNKSFCSVPRCSNSKQKQPYLRFHSFPADVEQKKKWVRAIRRDEGTNFVIRRGSTFVCSMHFTAADYAEGSPRLKAGVVPTRFQWNSFNVPPQRPSAFERASSRRGVPCPLESEAVEHPSIFANDHDYAARPPAGALDDALQYIEELEDRLQKTSKGSSSILSRFCVSDETIRYYTRFPSQQVFEIFWESIAPSATHLIYWTKAQRRGEAAIPTPSPARKIHLLDELFIYCLRVAAGLKEQVIADICGVSIATVSRIIITWANYLFFVLGSVPIWMSRQQVIDSMPEKFRQYSPKLRVILDCTEIRCESATSLTLHSETFSNYKNTTTFKGLLGVAPCGAVTFISSLFTGSISDKEITRQSGILELLEPEDEIMADKGFIIEDMLATKGARLIIPPFKHGKQFSKKDCEQTQAIARLRILVERVIRRVKENHIWDSTVPLSLAGSINQIWHNCCFMVNYQGPMFLDP